MFVYSCIINCLFFSFRYVLTRGLNSDPVESLFSSLRQFNGGNDRVDARAAVFTAEKLLKVLFTKTKQCKIHSCISNVSRLESCRRHRVQMHLPLLR